MSTVTTPPQILNDHDHYSVQWGDTVSFPNSRSFSQLAHRIFNRYPARSICLVPRSIISGFDHKTNRRQLRVLDPFMGSGTTAVETTIANAAPYGVELDSFARLIANVRVASADRALVRNVVKLCQTLSEKWGTFKSDHRLKPSLRNLDYWFDEKTHSDLLKFKTAIYAMTVEGSPERDFLRIILADMIRPCSLAERQTLKPYISKKYPKQPANVMDAFSKSSKAHIEAATEYSNVSGGAVQSIEWMGNDATSFSAGRKKIDLAITSPPYANALDYVRCIKLESSWIDCGNDESFTKIRSYQVGDPSRSMAEASETVEKYCGEHCEEIAKSDRSRAATILGYFRDMHCNLSNVFACLRGGGEYHLIIGDSCIRDVELPTHAIIAKLAESIGYSWFQYYKYDIRDHRTSMPRKGMGGKIRVEHVVSLRKDV